MYTLSVLRKYYRLVLPFLWKDWRCLFITVVTCVLTCVDSVVVPLAPWLFSEVLRSYEGDWGYVWRLTVLLSVCWLLTKTIKRLRSMVFFHVVNEAIRTIRLRLVMHFHHVSWEGGQRYDPDEVLSASTRVSMSVRFCLRVAFLNLFPTVVKLLTCGVAMQYAFGGSMYFLGAVLLTYGYVVVALRRFTRIRHGVWGVADEVMVAMGDSLRQRDFAKLHPEVEQRRLDALFERERRGWWKENVANYSIHLVQNMLFFFVTGGFLLYCVWLLREGVLDVPALVLLKGYVFVVYKQVFYLTEYVRGLCVYVVDMGKVLDILSVVTEEAKGRGRGDEALQDVDPVIKLEGVRFGYDGVQEKVLDGVSLEVKRGDTLVITGASGSGKSTLARLLAGLYLPDEGDVVFKGVSTRALSLRVMGQYMYCIGQDEPLMAGSIRDHLALGKGEEVAPLQYLEGVMEEDRAGRSFSGGERQRILLARCLGYQPDIVVLDEAFSYLDEESGRALFDMVREKVPTVILMTHRKTFFDKADRVYALVKGRLVAYEG